MDDRDKKITKGLTALMTQLELNGVAAVQVSDGYVYAFSKKKLLELVESCDKAKEEKVIVFVKHGVEPVEGQEN